MSDHPIDAHVRFDTHPAHTSAVTATLTGTHHRAAQALLAARGFENLDDHTMVLARIDHEEPYWAHQATHALHAEGITTEITPRLRKAIDEEWTWANYPMHWLTRAEVREVSNAAQSIYDDIRHGRLHHPRPCPRRLDHRRHRHLPRRRDRRPARREPPALHRRQTRIPRPGPRLLPTPPRRRRTPRTRPHDRHRTPDRRRGHLTRAPDAGEHDQPTHDEPPVPHTETVPVYAADPGDHDAVLDEFVAEQSDWEKWRTFSDDTTHVIHESQTLRIQLLHEADPARTPGPSPPMRRPSLTGCGTSP